MRLQVSILNGDLTPFHRHLCLKRMLIQVDGSRNLDLNGLFIDILK